jgi:hypothetical protein
MRKSSSAHRSKLVCGVVVGPLFMFAFTVIGARSRGYKSQRDAVSSLAVGPGGWRQRANFLLSGGLFCAAAAGLAEKRHVSGTTDPTAIPALVGMAGAGLIGSGVFVTDVVPGPTRVTTRGDSRAVRSVWRSGTHTLGGVLHDISAIPIFVGIPLAALLSAGAALRRHDHLWAVVSSGAGLLMPASFVLFGAAAGGGVPRLTGRAGACQRVSIAAGFGWVTAVSLRALRD